MIGVGLGLTMIRGRPGAAALPQVYYVAKTGNDANPGTAGSPRLTIAAGYALLAPGDTLIVGDGTYNENLNLTSGGTPGRYKTIWAANKRMAVLGGTGWAAILRANYIAIDGLKFDKTGGGGGVTCDWEKHHHTIVNCEGVGGSDHGIAALGGEFYRFEGNYFHGGRYSDFWSAISIYQARNVTGDTTTTGFRNVIRNNICEDNYQVSGWHTDGNGIIVDDLWHTQSGTFNFAVWAGVVYPYPTLVEGNLCVRNGGKGLQIFLSSYVTVRSNTAAFNNRDADNDGTWRGEISGSACDYCTFVNNVGVARSNSTGYVGSAENSGRLTDNSGLGWYAVEPGQTAHTIWRNNLGWDVDASKNYTRAENTPHSLDSLTGHVFADPLFVTPQPDALGGDYRVQFGSPAVGVGTPAYGHPTLDLAGNARVFETIDIGAYESAYPDPEPEEEFSAFAAEVPAGGPVTGDDGSTYTLGTKLRFATAGRVTAIRYYAHESDPAGRGVALYQFGNGTPLATATAPAPGVTGWVTVPITPVDVGPGTIYIAALNKQANTHAYFSTPFKFSAQIVGPGGQVIGIANSEHANGVFTTALGAYPDQSFNSSFYWTDVVFSESFNPADTRLRWAPVAQSSPTSYAVTNGYYAVTLGDTEDAIFTNVGQGNAGSDMEITGGRNIRFIGISRRGRITVKNNKGSIYFEGCRIDLSSTTNGRDAINAYGAPGFTPDVTIQNCYVTGVKGTNAGSHGDIFQPQGPVGRVRIDKLTGDSNYQGIFIRPEFLIASAEIVRTNLAFNDLTNPGPDNNTYLLWPRNPSGQSAPGDLLYPVHYREVYVAQHESRTPIQAAVYPTNETIQGFAGTVATPDAYGHVHYDGTANIWGKVYNGAPPGGDFVSSSAVGVGYVAATDWQEAA